MISLITKWGKNKADTWSGTPLGILTGLQKIHNIDNVRDITVSTNKMQKICCKLASGIGKVLHINECEVVEHKIDDRIVKRLLREYYNEPNIMSCLM